MSNKLTPVQTALVKELLDLNDKYNRALDWYDEAVQSNLGIMAIEGREERITIVYRQIQSVKKELGIE